LGGRKNIRPVKKLEWWGTGMVICLERDADLQMAQLMPLPLTVSCFSKIQIVFTFLVPAHLGSPGKRAVKRVCVCVCMLLIVYQYLTTFTATIVTLCRTVTDYRIYITAKFYLKTTNSKLVLSTAPTNQIHLEICQQLDHKVA